MLAALACAAALSAGACDTAPGPEPAPKTNDLYLNPKARTNFATRQFKIFCGKYAESTLSPYAKHDTDLDNEARSLLARNEDPTATACVPAERAAEVERRLGDMVDHFDRWGIRPHMPLFGPAGAPFYRLYVRPLEGDNTAFADSWKPPTTGVDDTVSHINADTVRAFSPTRPVDSVHYFLAHELTHVMQRWSPAIANSPSSAHGEARLWVTEGMADAVGLRLLREATGHWRVDADPTLVYTPTMLRNYARPLPATDASYSTVGKAGVERATEALDHYRTSSLFTFMMERYGGDDPAFFAKLLAEPTAARAATNTDWVGWLDRASRAATKRSLGAVYRAFIPHFASWGFTRFYRFGLRGAKALEAKFQPAQWLVDAFDGCTELELSPSAIREHKVEFPAMTARCLSLTIEAPAGHTARLEFIAEGAPETVLRGLGVGLARVEGAGPWDCAAKGSMTDCEVPGVTTTGSTLSTTWTTDPIELSAQGHGTAIVTLTSFPDDTRREWLDRTDKITLKIGLRSARVASALPAPSPPEHTSAAGPLTGALTAVAHRGARPSLPIAAAALPGTAPAWLDAMFLRPELLGTTGVTAEALADAPAGLPGLALYTYAPGEPTPARVYQVVFGQPVPLGFSGVTAGYVVGTIDPTRAPPQMVGPPNGEPVAVKLDFTADRLALSFSAPLCLGDLDRLGTSPDPAALAANFCVARGTLEADVSLPFGQYYVLGAAPPVDPESVRYTAPGPGADGGDGAATGDAAADGHAHGDAHGGAPAVDTAALSCECTCARFAAWLAEGNALAAEAARVTETLDLAAIAAGATLPPDLSKRMDEHAAYEPCVDRCLDVYSTCQ